MAYQAKRNKRFEEDFELVDENGVVQHTLKVSLDADDMVAKINRKYTALVRALSDVQEIKRKEASNEQLSDAVEMLGRAEIDMFEVVSEVYLFRTGCRLQEVRVLACRR